MPEPVDLQGLLSRPLCVKSGESILCLQFDYLCATGNSLFLAWWATGFFSVNGLDANGRITGEAFVFQTEKEKILRINNEREKARAFFAVLPFEGQNSLNAISLNWKNRQLRIAVDKSCIAGGLADMRDYLPKDVSAILANLPRYSPAWHELLYHSDRASWKNYLSRHLDSYVDKFLAALSFRQWRIMPGLEIYGLDGSTVSARLEKAKGNASWPFDLYYADGNFSLKKLKFINAVKTAEDREIFTYRLDPWFIKSCSAAFVAINPDDGAIASFRIFDLIAPAANYLSIVLDALSPRIIGWCVNSMYPAMEFDIGLLLDGCFYASAKNDLPRPDLRVKKISAGKGGFAFASPEQMLFPGKYRLSLRLPDGSVFADQKLAAIEGRKSMSQLPAPEAGETTVIIIIEEDCFTAGKCLRNLVKYSRIRTRFIVLSKAGVNTDNLQKELPAEFVVFAEGNLPKALNEAVLLAVRGDIILLQPYLFVNSRWIENLSACASLAGDIGMVQPLIHIWDLAGQEQANAAYGLTWPVATRRLSQMCYPASSCGSFGCVYISRKCLESMGEFSISFPNGFAWLADFMLRAIRDGWKCLVDDRTLMTATPAFAAKWILPEASLEALDGIYPEYRHIRKNFAVNPGQRLAANRCIAAREKSGEYSGLRVLFVVSTKTGGTVTSNLDMARELSGKAQCYQLQCDSKTMVLSSWNGDCFEIIEKKVLKEPVNSISHISTEYDKIAGEWLFRYDIDIAHIHHLIWHSLNFVSVAKKCGCKVVWLFHDFYALSPNLNLLDDSGTFCGDDFCSRPSPYRINMWRPPHPSHDAEFLEFWRARWTECLNKTDALVFFSESTAKFVNKFLPDLAGGKIHIIPHGRNFPEFLNLKQPVSKDRPLKILVPGNISAAKGSFVLENLAAYDRAHGKRLEFHILGDSVLQPAENIVPHGRFEQDELYVKIMEIMPHMAIIPSIWPETWCHTLTEMWACGLPVLALDSGIVAERIRGHGGGWILASDDTPGWHEEILQIAEDYGLQEKASHEIARWKKFSGKMNSAAFMMGQYMALYNQLLHGRAAAV